MTGIGVYPIVEGHGEVEAVRALVRRFANELHGVYDLSVLEPFRLPRTKFARDDEVARALQLAAVKLSPFARGHVLVLMDGDDDCPCAQHERVLRIAQSLDLAGRVSFVMPVREYEAWLIDCRRPGERHPDIREDAPMRADVSAIRDAKTWFRTNVLVPGRHYAPSVDQAKFTFLLDLEATHNRAMVKLRKEMAAIFAPAA